jgi:Tol biopolymer transport system component/predicted Ser/Thr protein kinase
MILSPGGKLGHYEVIAQIGAGGMGEVYRARDPRLNRDVAIKVSNERFSERFEREARAVAALNHPNICTLYDVGPNYLVMEFIEGESPHGPMPLDTALDYAKQIAAALEEAHDKGVVHRDLKPGNIKIKPDGTVKVLDFGLAKVAPASAGDSENSPTLSMAAATQAGVILGTAAYMSPEQARGKPVDKRADIWAFGVVLYEIITGKRLFQGEDLTETLASVVMKEPDLSAAPLKVRGLLKRCLEKDPKKRLRDISGVSLLLEDPTLASRARLGMPAQIAIGALGAAVIALGVTLWTLWPRTVDRALVRLEVDLGPDVSLGSAAGPDVTISPDGNRIVYASQGRLVTRRLDQPGAVNLPGTEGGFAPFFSPDGQWIAFSNGTKLKKISVEGGAAIDLCEAPAARGGSWGQDGTIVASLANAGALWRVPETGGKPTPLTELDRQRTEFTHRWPQILPGGKAVLFTSHTAGSGFDDANIDVISLTDHHRKTLQRGGLYGRYLATSTGGGHLVYPNRGTLFAVPFDLDRLELRGAPTPVLTDVLYSPATGSAQFDFSPRGTLVYRRGGAEASLVTVQWLESSGKTQPLLARPGDYLHPALSPNGSRLALISSGDVWVYEIQRGNMTRLTVGGGGHANPTWSPDGRYIAFQSAEGMSWTRSDSSSPQPLTRSKNTQFPYSFSPDGKRLAFYENDPQTSFDLWTLPLEDDGVGLRAGKAESFLQTSADERHATFSPDGRWLAYDTTVSGAQQVTVQAFASKGGQLQVSTNGGFFPVWSRNTHELFFRTLDNQIMVLSYSVKGDAFLADTARPWTDKRLANVGAGRSFDPTPDGKRLAALLSADTAEPKAQHEVTLLENFFDEVRRRAGK